MKDFVYRKVEQHEIDKILSLAEKNLDFPIGNEEKILRNWVNIEAVGGFCGERLIALLITDPYNLVRWTTGRNIPDLSGRINIKTASLLEPLISSEFIEIKDLITADLLEAYFDNMSYCDEMVIHIMSHPEDLKRRTLLQEAGFVIDEKFPKKMVLKAKWEHFAEKKRKKIQGKIKFFLEKLGLPFEDIDENLFYTELVVDEFDVVIYILSDEYEGGHNIIKFFSYLAAPPEINRDVVRYLLELNFRSSYGSFCVDPDGNILIINSKAGHCINEGDIEIFLKISAMSIIKYTEEIIALFGGDEIFDCILRTRPEFPSDYRYLLIER